MLQWKSAWSICPNCRVRLLATTGGGGRRTLATATARNSFGGSGLLRTRIPSRSTLSSSSSSLRLKGFATSSTWCEGHEAGRKETEVEDEPPPPLAEAREGAELATDEAIEGRERSELAQEDIYDAQLDGLEPGGKRASPEEMARAARNFFGDSLPQGALLEEELAIYKRLYGEPSSVTTDHLVEEAEEEEGDVLLRDNEDGTVDEFEYVQEPDEDQVVDEDADLDEEEDADLDGMADDVAALRQRVGEVDLSKDPSYDAETLLTFGETPEEEDFVANSRPRSEILDEIYDNWPGDDYVRSHPFTDAGRFGTKPSTLLLPRDAFVAPVQDMLSDVANKHLSEQAYKLLGGVGIPDSPSTPAIARSKGQRPIPLTAFQGKMSPMDANVFVSSIMPQVYASAVSVLVECRKRLGSQWLRRLMKTQGGPLVLDVGAGGAGIIAFKEILRAEWESMQEEAGPGARPKGGLPVARATVVTGSDSLRFKASALLENTTFIPRLPDHVDPTQTETNSQQPRKRYDVIIAPHTLWPLVEDHERKARTQTLWSLLNPDGGLLILIEKGVPRGFEVIAGARDLLLKRHISSPDSAFYQNSVEDQAHGKNERFTVKEKGAIIAPCTNHTQCPLYPVPGMSKGRKDWCYFQQRYTRPSFLMNILQAKARNHDDVEFSYLAVQRGADPRKPEDDGLMHTGVVQDADATEKAKLGYGRRDRRAEENEKDENDAVESAEPISKSEFPPTEESSSANQDEVAPHPLSLPRILPNPLKRKGHILIDVCTPSGTYERWMVRRGMGKQAFRDARKAKWGDLWALGAVSSELRRVKLGSTVEVAKGADKRARERVKGWRKGRDAGKGKWRYSDGNSGSASSTDQV